MSLDKLHIERDRFRKCHTFLPESENIFINSKYKLFFCRVEGGDSHCKFYWLPVVTEGAEPLEGSWIARSWIIDPKVYPVYQCPNDSVRARGDSGGYRQPFCSNVVFL